MSNYLIELSVVHITLMTAYLLFFRNENQYGKMRAFILGATILSVTIPLLKLPKLFFNNSTELYYAPLEEITVAEAIRPAEPTGFDSSLLLWGYLLVSAFFLIRFLMNMGRLFALKRKSHAEAFDQISVRRAHGIDGSFTFFNWIFLSDNVRRDDQEYDVILRHEKAHASLGHTYDLIFLELFKIAFWGLPTAWFTQKEIKKIHEYQADAFAVKSYSVDRYSSILISSTLKANGLSLASSFHDGLIFKRLKAMKQNAKNVSPWKLGMITMLTATLFIVFACSEESSAQDDSALESSSQASEEGEVFTKVESLPEYPGGMTALYEFVGSNMKYPKQASQMGVEGKVFVQFIVEKDGTISNVEAVKGIGAGCDAEAVRVVQQLQSFAPGKQRGRAVRVKMVLPVMFALGEADDKKTGALHDEVKTDFNKMRVAAKYANGKWSGTIYDAESGKAMPGVNIIEEGTNSGTVSDHDGTFSIEVSSKTNDLILSHVGFKASRLKAS